jgi:hypothetical protein
MKSTFVSGGIAPDTIREIYGNLGQVIIPDSNPDYWINGVFKIKSQNLRYATGGSGSQWVDFAASRMVKTGPQVQPVHLSKRLWRRVS